MKLVQELLLERLRYNRIESDRTPFWIVLALRRGCNLTRVDYANTLGVYMTEYTQCNSNYASIGGTTSMTSFVCRHYTQGGREASRRRWSNFIPAVPPVNFRFKSEISSSTNIYTGNDNNAIILETILHSIVSNDWSDPTFHSYFTNKEMRSKLWIIWILCKKKHHGITITRRYLNQI